MDDKLTKEEVMHVAELARIEISNEEMEIYQKKLKKLLNNIEKIIDINDNDEDYLIAPWYQESNLREDKIGDMLEPKDVLKNVPRKSGNYIEVPVVINE